MQVDRSNIHPSVEKKTVLISFNWMTADLINFPEKATKFLLLRIFCL